MKKKTLLAAAAIACMASVSWAHAERVVVSVKPLHSLVQAVMGDASTAQLLLRSNHSPHKAHLRPSQVKALHNADLVFYIDKRFEVFLSSALASLPETVRQIALAQAATIGLLKLRGDKIWTKRAGLRADRSHEQRPVGQAPLNLRAGLRADRSHEQHDGKRELHLARAGSRADRSHEPRTHHASHDHAAHGEHDMHIWLDPVRAQAMASVIVAALSEAFPDKRTVYQANAERLDRELQQLDRRLEALLAEVNDRPYIVFHDAYQYLERRYRLAALASITDAHDGALSPRHLKELRSLVADKQIACIFSEPQWADKNELLQTIIADSEAEIGVLDPLGMDLREGGKAYFQMMDELAVNLRGCLLK